MLENFRNSRYCSTYVDNNLRFANWKRNPVTGCKCRHETVVDACGCSPNDFLPDDWSKINATAKKQLYFGRKFEPVVSQSVLDEVDFWIDGEKGQNRHAGSKNGASLEHSSRTSYWQNIYHFLVFTNSRLGRTGE